ncbi:MAG: ATP-binding protein [Bacteroidales bacterium]|nr:ATP-binding protein [Bacteroidales bacterium]
MELPFPFEKIAAGKSILGRGEELGFLIDVLDQGRRGVAVIGGARTGKETLVTEAIETWRSRNGNCIVCTIDLFNVRSSEHFADIWRQKMRTSADEVNRGALLPFEISFDDIPGSKLFDLPGIIAAEAGRRMIVYIKEFQNLLKIEDETFRLELLDRSWSRHKGVTYLMTGSSVNSMKSIFYERKCFYGMCRTLEIGPLDKKLVCEYIHSTFLDFGRVIEMEEVLAIYDIAGGDIWYVKQLCAFCYAIPAGYVNRRIVNRARDMLLSVHIPRFKQIMFDLTGNQVNLLHAIVDGVQKFTSAEIMERYRLNSSAGVSRVKDALQKKEVITFDGEDNARIIDPLFAWWLKNHYFVS